jgi:hypothetical protein
MRRKIGFALLVVLLVVLLVGLQWLPDDWPDWMRLLVAVPLGLVPTYLILVPPDGGSS